MMRIALVSDTHENWLAVAQNISQEIASGGAIDYLFFLGDHASDGRQLQQYLKLPAYIVRGNCDWMEQAPEEQVVELGAWRFLLCHGHRYQVKQQLQSLYFRGLELGVDFAIYGHTHQAYYEETPELTLVNPGSGSAASYRCNNASWGLLTLSEQKNENFLKKFEKKACQMF